MDNLEPETYTDKNDLEKLYELPMDIINSLKPIFKLVHPTQLAFQLCNKIREPSPIYTQEADDNYKFKYTAYLDKDISVMGYNDQKKEAKKIASEMVVFEMIKNPKYQDRTIQVLIKDYNVDPKIYNDYKKRKPISLMANINRAKNKKNIIKEAVNNDDHDNDNDNDNDKDNEEEEDNNVLLSHKRKRSENEEDKEDKKNETTIITSSPFKVANISDKKNKTEINVIQTKTSIPKSLQLLFKIFEPFLPEEFKTEVIQPTLLNFELFCLKWERILLLDKETTISLSKFIQVISLIILKLKIKMKIQDSFTIGSYSSSTLRVNMLTIDYLIILQSDPNNTNPNNTLPSNTFEDFIELSSPDLIKNEYHIDIKSQTETIPSYLEITNKDLKCKIDFIILENSKHITDHIAFLSKNQLSIEQEISIKILKAWRRGKSLLFLNPIIIEFIILQMSFPLINQIIISFYAFIGDIDEDAFSTEYHRELISNLKLSTQYPKLLDEARLALEAIKKNNFSDLF